MLTDLRIRNLGVIADAEIEFHPGFTVITGETGAGKTMLISSLRLLMGDRSDFSKIRRTKDDVAPEAFAEGIFSFGTLPAEKIAELQDELADCGAQQDDDGSIIALRSIRADGRSRAHLGGRAVPANALARFTEPLVTIHGQHDQLRLLQPASHREILDQYAGQPAAELLASYRKVWRTWRETGKLLSQKREECAAEARELTQLQMAVSEIREAQLEPAEDAVLQNDIRRLMDADELRDEAARALHSLNGDTSFISAEMAQTLSSSPSATACADDLIGAARSYLAQSSDKTLQELGERLDTAVSVIEDVSSEVHDYLQELDVDPQVVEQKLERQALVKQIVRKYGVDVDSVLSWCAEAESRIAQLTSSENSIESLLEQEAKLHDEASQLADRLTALRQAKASQLAEDITDVLSSLAMGSSEITIEVKDLPATSSDADRGRQLGEYGADSIDILFRSSSNSPAQPISKVASGGELSRVMLAIEVILADQADPRTLIFDEVDSGIGGRTALQIGQCLARLAGRHQVIVVTHLPQVAAFGDHHLTVLKDNRTEGAVTRVHALSKDERVVEIARMLAGLEKTDTGQAHAEELLAAAQETKAARKA